MTRPRIRTLKPEMWADEKIGRLSRDARLLFVVLITMADDDGRFRAMDLGVLGHGYPYDRDAVRKLDGWMGELETQDLVVLYEVDGVRYGLIVNWERHQKINKPTPSSLPAPYLNDPGGVHA